MKRKYRLNGPNIRRQFILFTFCIYLFFFRINFFYRYPVTVYLINLNPWNIPFMQHNEYGYGNKYLCALFFVCSGSRIVYWYFWQLVCRYFIFFPYIFVWFVFASLIDKAMRSHFYRIGKLNTQKSNKSFD